MRVVTGCTNLPIDRAKFALPVAARAAMNACFPIPIRWAVATAAQSRTVRYLQVATIPCLELFEIVLIVAIETVVVAMVPSVTHDNIAVFFGNDNVAVGVQFKFRRVLLVVAGVTVKD